MAYQKGNPLWYCRRCGFVKRISDRRVEETGAEVCKDCFDQPAPKPQLPPEPKVVLHASNEPEDQYVGITRHNEYDTGD